MKLKVDVVSLSQSSEIEEIFITILVRVLTFHPTIINVQKCFMISSLTKKMLGMIDKLSIFFLIYPEHFFPDSLSG